MIRRTAIIVSGIAAITAAMLYQPPADLLAGSSAVSATRSVPVVEASTGARGISGEVRMRFVRAGERLAFPLAVRGAALGFTYQWIKVGGTESGDVARPLDGDTLLAPLEAGFYELVVSRSGISQRIAEPRLAVLVPFELKLGSSLNGYQIGRYPSEWAHDEQAERPVGFAEVHADELDLPLTRHLKLRDFLTHDAQTIWPRYLAIDPRVLDKIELVLSELARRRGEERMDFDLEVTADSARRCTTPAWRARRVIRAICMETRPMSRSTPMVTGSSRCSMRIGWKRRSIGSNACTRSWPAVWVCTAADGSIPHIAISTRAANVSAGGAESVGQCPSYGPCTRRVCGAADPRRICESVCT